MGEEVKGNIIGIRIFVSDNAPKKHNCFKKVSKYDFEKFIDGKDLTEDIYMDQNSFYDTDMTIIAKVERYGEDMFYIRKCFVKHRSKPIDKTKGHWQTIRCQVDSSFTITKH